ncbi:MAG: extracellular substrate binding-like orphan protein GrrP [Pegethrix bostrychoides GSE-TBD4-15B]|uniref:Extracellular substrate binding-like orphan protein GrrP n=1 Tax=Pegethrix bostrychoides GSE-TBD4-15B TaxID=2839662 RepID=A0A951U4E3_9CYAN|nr:extracellular substrate binding-like orphan protein GrrP [Pegethrix bostrychoides GSE-TBD4-15B]
MNKLSIALLGCLLALTSPGVAKAETVMEKAARTGYLNAGFHFDTIPYTYVDGNQELVGYSVDTIDLIKAALEKELGKPIELLTQPITFAAEDGNSDVITQIQNHNIDIACDVGFSWERARFVDFSVSNSISGLKLLVQQDSNLSSPESLAGKRIAVAPGSPAEAIMQHIQPQAVLVTSGYSTVQETIAALEQGQVDAIAGDALILDGTRQAQPNPDDLKLVPDSPYARYGVGCVVPQNNSSFLRLVNQTIIGTMQGYLSGESQSVEMIERWFGADGLTPVAPDLIRSFFAFQVQTHAQVAPDANAMPIRPVSLDTPR